MPNKTKAALQGRQCQNSNQIHSQLITQIDHVKQCSTVTGFPVSLRLAGGCLSYISGDTTSPKFLGGVFPVVCDADILTAPLAQFIKAGCSLNQGRDSALGDIENYHLQNILHLLTQIFGAVDRVTHSSHVQLLEDDVPNISSHGDVIISLLSFLHCTNEKCLIIPIDTKIINIIVSNFFIANYPLASIPRCCSSLRIIRLIQADKDSSPSCCWACSIISRNSGSRRNWNGGLPRLSFLCVDTSITPDVMCLCVVTHYTHEKQKATPRSVGARAGRLTTNAKATSEAAMNNHITPLNGRNSLTLNKFTWRFLALNRHDKKAKPCRLSVEATTEHEARRILAPHFILSFATRLPVQEVRHV